MPDQEAAFVIAKGWARPDSAQDEGRPELVRGMTGASGRPLGELSNRLDWQMGKDSSKHGRPVDWSTYF